MIKDTIILQEIGDEWGVVPSTQRMIATNNTWNFAAGGSISREYANLAYSLCLLFAFSVLEHALLQMKDEGLFSSRSNFLGPLMQASNVSAQIWLDYSLIDDGRQKRNDIAHRQIWIQSEDCRRYIDGIEAELKAWGIM